MPMLEHRARVRDEDELRRRLPEIDGVRGRVRDEVIDVFVNDIHEYFWLARASVNHHPPDERGLGGTWLHTKRVFTAYTILERTFRAMNGVSSFEANCARAAVLLHDGFKYGGPPYEFENDPDDDSEPHTYADDHLHHLPNSTVRDHDVQMAEWIRTETDMPEEVAHAVECHGGSPDWYSHAGPRPDDDLTLLVHLADLMASCKEYRLPVYAPCEEIEIMVGDVPTVSDDWIESLNDF